ncbi:MAG: saccharopine dehydrogenase family protein [Pseudomonadales bacterium]
MAQQPETPSAHQEQREIDVLVWGATGFTGNIVARYMNSTYGASNLTWGLGGRNQSKLEAVRNALSEAGADAPLYLADSHDPAQMRELVGKARVVLTTVGPYAKYGNELVAACAELGTHYCDLTGEVHWMRRMIDAHQETAQASGARIVHTCGFDSIPSDLGVYFLQRAMQDRYGCASPWIKCRTRAFSGGFSGGTVDSMMTMMEQAKDDPDIKRIIADPYALNPSGAREGLDGPDRQSPEYDQDFEAWIGPFVMSQINTRVVRRSNAVMGYPYGRDFRYDEASIMPGGALGGFAAAGMSLTMATVNAMAAFAPTRSLLQSMAPKPGEGPSEEAQRKGFFHIELLAQHPTDRSKDLRAHVKGDRDPGYGSTAKMLSECAVSLAQDESPVGGGFWTPAAAMGDALLERLPANAGVTFELDD